MAGSVWDEVLDTEHAVVVRTYIERWPRRDRPPEKVLVIVVEPDEETRCRCPECGQRGRAAEYDVVRWRTLDVHGKRAFLESALPRIICPRHGKVTAAVPWARHDAAAGLDRLDGLRRIGIDEKSWGKGQGKYLVIVTDHDAGRSPGSARAAARSPWSRSSMPSARSGRSC